MREKPKPASRAPRYITPAMLDDIRESSNRNWQQVFAALELEAAKGSKPDEWWASSPFSEETHPSFHISEKGWFCFSTDQGGGVIELVERVMRTRGQAMNCFEAGRWLLEKGFGSLGGTGSVGELPDAAPGHFPSSAHSPPPAFSSASASSSPSSASPLSATPAIFPAPAEPEAVSREGGKKEKGGRLREGDRDAQMPSEAVGIEENRPVRQTLVPSLNREHEALGRRGISQETCAYLGCGYLPEEGSRSPLRGRIVFQVRGVRKDPEGVLRPAILTHMGRATTEAQEAAGGKWKLYEGFLKSRELYNIDKVLLDEEAVRQARATGRVIVTEGCFDVAKLVEANIRNAVATFGWHLSEKQLPQLDRIAEQVGIDRFLFLYDRDEAGRRGMEQASGLLRAQRPGRYEAEVFDWEKTFPSPVRGSVKIPEAIGDVSDFSVEQLKWLRERKII